VPLPEYGNSILRAGEYVIDVYLWADASDLMPRQQNASASFEFSTVLLDTPLPEIPEAPSSPISPISDTYIYFDSPPEDLLYLGYVPLQHLLTQSKGHPWYSSYLYDNHYYYVEGFPYLGYRFEQGLLSASWLTADADPRLLYSATSNNPSDYNYFSISTPLSDSYQPVNGLGEFGPPVGLDANGGMVEISASYSVLGNQTWGSAYGFMLRIDVDDGGAVIQHSASGPITTISSFESGKPLSAGSYFFGVVADPQSMPSGLIPDFPWWQGGSGSVSLNVTRIQPPAPNPPPKVTNSFRSSGNFTLQWADQFNRAVHVQRSTNLSSTNWQTVRSNVSTKTFTDTNPPTGSAFYRLLVP
jgi:hypothetical protein